MPTKNKSQPVTNRLLAALPKKEYQRLLPDLEAVTLTFGEILFEPGDTLRHVYFPDNSIVSLLTAVEEHAMLEVGLVGNEGMVGLPVFMGVDESQSRGLVQRAGNAMRMNAALFRKEGSTNGPLNKLLLRYTHSLLTQVTQSAACHRFHLVNARLSRWLLMMHDRVEGDEFCLTQELLSNMLGVRRERVSLTASNLKKQKLIGYSRGQIRILDRAGLEADSCACYEVMKEAYANFSG